MAEVEVKQAGISLGTWKAGTDLLQIMMYCAKKTGYNGGLLFGEDDNEVMGTTVPAGVYTFRDTRKFFLLSVE